MFLANTMSIQDLDLVVLHCGFEVNFKLNVSFIKVTKVSLPFFFKSILKSPANIMGMVLRPSSGTIEYSSENFGADVPN
jgi:hypothetical protein